MDKIPFSVYDFFSYLASGSLFLIIVDYAFDRGNLAKPSPPIGYAIFWILLAYILGHLIAHLSSMLLEVNFLRKVLGSPEEHLLAEKSNNIWIKLFPDNFKPLPKTVQEKIFARATKEGVFTVLDRSFFFHCHAIAKRDRATLERLNQFLNQYGFCRNITMVLLIAAVTLPLGIIVQFIQGKYGSVNWQKLIWGVI